MAVVLTSTTEPQENLEHAVSEEWRDAEALKPALKPIEEPPKPEVEEPTPEAEPQPEVAVKPKEHKSGWQKRIDKLTARNHSVESENQRLKEENERFKAQNKPAGESRPV